MCKDFMVKIMSFIKYIIKDLNKCRHDRMPLINYSSGPNSMLYRCLTFYSAVPLNTEEWVTVYFTVDTKFRNGISEWVWMESVWRNQRRWNQRMSECLVHCRYQVQKWNDSVASAVHSRLIIDFLMPSMS